MQKNEKVIPNKEIIRRLDAIIALLAQASEREIGKTIVILRTAGLRPIEISRILGKSLSYVTATLAIARRRSSRGKECER